ncbi:DUF4230 domain-containing protein [uncultured Faecalibaculum sp.]|uniref:DUF4230 domain-containing protein n=1 Tax=uncultured Faecalibaculum sp. TaxID=1729681 RepID=UPI0025D04202|nr:DUF4230 domain-containing protein [uncultured Faecalibaculum sp.]
MKRMTSLLAALLIGVIAGAFLFFGAVNLNIVQSQPEVTGKVVLRELESASSLITTRYNYSKVGKYENSLEINGWSIPLTDKFFILTYDGQALLGCDLDTAQVDVNKSAKTITVTLDPVKILSSSIDEKSIEVYDESKNLFNPISVNDYKEFASRQKEAVEEEIRSKPVFEEAKENTVKAITEILGLTDGIRDVYTVQVEFREGAEDNT